MIKKIAVYPGTFDPFTYGHLDVVRRASKMFEKIIISVAENANKTSLFNIKERKEIIEEVIINETKLDNIQIKGFNGLLVDHVKDEGAVAVLRGLRALSDFEYEFQMTGMNKNLFYELETIFLMSSEKYSFISSKLVKEVHKLGGNVDKFVSKDIVKKLNKKI